MSWYPCLDCCVTEECEIYEDHFSIAGNPPPGWTMVNCSDWTAGSNFLSTGNADCRILYNFVNATKGAIVHVDVNGENNDDELGVLLEDTIAFLKLGNPGSLFITDRNHNLMSDVVEVTALPNQWHRLVVRRAYNTMTIRLVTSTTPEDNKGTGVLLGETTVYRAGLETGIQGTGTSKFDNFSVRWCAATCNPCEVGTLPGELIVIMQGWQQNPNGLSCYPGECAGALNGAFLLRAGFGVFGNECILGGEGTVPYCGTCPIPVQIQISILDWGYWTTGIISGLYRYALSVRPSTLCDNIPFFNPGAGTWWSEFMSEFHVTNCLQFLLNTTWEHDGYTDPDWDCTGNNVGIQLQLP